MLQNVRNKFKVEVNKVEAAMTKKKSTIQNKGQDSFYQIRSLDPKIQDKGKYYFLELKIPSHEKEGLTFNASQRELRINFQRSYASDMTDEMGTINKSKRNELFTKIMKTKDILDPAGVRSQYNNEKGVLEVLINKA